MATQPQQQKDLVWYRQFLNDKGYANDQISYNNGAVYAGNQLFDYVTPNDDGKTYGSLDHLENRYNTLQNQQQNTQVNQRQNEVYDTLGQLREQMEQRLNTPAQPFSYNPQEDPNYQAALQAAMQAASVGQSDTLAKLRSQGQGHSSYSDTVANQIMQGSIQDVQTQQLPVFMNQAYGRHRDQIGDERNQMSDLMNIINTYAGLNQQDVANMNTDKDQAFRNMTFQTENDNWNRSFEADQAYRNRTADAGDEQDRVALAQWLTNSFGVPVSPQDDAVTAFAQVMGLTPMARQQFEHGQGQDRIANSQRNRGLALQESQEGRMSSNANIERLMQVWRNTGVAPEGIPGVQPGTRLAGSGETPSMKPTDYKTNPEWSSDYQRILNDPEGSALVLQQNAQAFIDAYGYDGYQALLRALPEDDW